ncbi:MAG: hypothetical protein EA391_06360 [Balneolaceae bacterium]|nr:MAG: hypothetical protein EA391_06360 [Balneolaceae bacterium]
MNTDEEFIVIIRSAGERTTEACKLLVRNELPADNIQVINLVPFEEALRESYRLGIESKKKWLITIDADVLPRPGFIKTISQKSDEISGNVFSFKAMVFDKFFIKHRLAGFRVYRTKLLSKALRLIPENGIQIRPEEFTVNLMEKKGYKTKVLEYVVGLHDFQQSYKDLYRKAFFHAVKHPKEIGENIAAWKELAKADDDYRVMLKGAVDGLLSKESPTADIRFFENLAEKALYTLSISEKQEANYTDIEHFLEEQMAEVGTFTKGHSWKSAKKRMRRYGKIKGITHHAAFLMEMSGKLIKKRIER